VILPARVRRPRDKAKVESAVQVVEQSILAPLRDRRFFSLEEANQAIAGLCEELNSKAFQALPGSRRTAFETVDRPALRPLPLESYEFAIWKKVRVRMDYHVPIEGHCYSVPHRHAGQELAVRLTARTVECFAGTTRIAAHLRSDEQGGHTTVGEHMPESHRRYAEATAERLVEAAERIGVATAGLARRIVATGGHREQSARLLTGVLALGKAYGAERLEAAAARALEIGALRYQSIASILKQGLDRQALPTQQTEPTATITHDNLRGAGYYAIADTLETADVSSSIDQQPAVGSHTNHQLTGGPTHVEHAHA
jgi:transposase